MVKLLLFWDVLSSCCQVRDTSCCSYNYHLQTIFVLSTSNSIWFDVNLALMRKNINVKFLPNHLFIPCSVRWLSPPAQHSHFIDISSAKIWFLWAFICSLSTWRWGRKKLYYRACLHEQTQISSWSPVTSAVCIFIWLLTRGLGTASRHQENVAVHPPFLLIFPSHTPPTSLIPTSARGLAHYQIGQRLCVSV